MNGILNFLQKNMNVMIILIGILIAVLLIVNAVQLAHQRTRIQDALNWKKRSMSINKKTRELQEHEEAENITPETIHTYEKEFNKVCSGYNVLAQFIPVFPLLGILGTVSGLMLQVSSQDIASMTDSLDLALGSTWWGLVFAIFLKVLVAVTSNRIIEDVEILLEDYDKIYSDLVTKRSITEE